MIAMNGTSLSVTLAIRLMPRALGERGRLRRAEGQPARPAADAAQPAGGPRRAGALGPAAGALRPAAADPRRQPPRRPRPGHAVLHPRGAGRAAAPAVPRRVSPRAGA